MQILCAFRVEDGPQEYFNFGFPLAPGNLKKLFRGDIDKNPLNLDLELSWTQFQGLASALTFLHETLQTVHRDIKPSNILIYPADDRRSLLLKITDFGLAVDLRNAITWEAGSKESRSAWFHDAPDFRSSYVGSANYGMPAIINESA